MISRCVASHVVCVAEVHGLLMGIEMTWPRIHRVDLTDLGRVVWWARHAQMTRERGKEATEFLWSAYERSVKYDVAGLGEFLGIGDDAKKKYYCSELVREMYKACRLAVPVGWRGKVDPLSVQEFHSYRGELHFV